jgi:hypothetical protein
MNNSNEIKSVEIFSGSEWEIGLVKSLLENVEINVYINGGIQGTRMPWDSMFNKGALRIMISSEDYEKARIVVDEFNKNMQINNE